MKHIASSAILAAFIALSAPLSAQTTVAGTGNASMDSAAPQEPKQPATALGHRARHATADARACLQFTTNVAITRCAEKYR